MLERDAIRELCDYTDFTWAVYERALGSLPPGMLTTAVPGSGWPALIDAFRHFCDAYETWLHERLGARAVIVADPASVVDWPGIAEWRRQTRASLRRVLADTPDDRFHVADIPISNGVAMNMSVADILAHLLLHERGHHGDVSTLFYHFGAELPSMDYRVYLHLKRSAKR